MMTAPAYGGSLLPGNVSGWTKGVPAEYLKEAPVKGKVIRITYSSRDYAGDGHAVEKVANVYLPPGYDEKDEKKRYDVFYFMHGWSGTADEFFGYGGGLAKNLIDNMIGAGCIEPMIVVAPTFDAENKPQGFERAVSEVQEFHQDFINDLLPAVEGRYHTYALSPTKEAFKDSRDHRAFGGFSLGSVTTWEQFIMNSDYIRYFMPMSSGCWHFGGYGSSRPVENCEVFEKTIREKGLLSKGFFIYAATGTNDTLRPEVDLQIREMLSGKYSFSPENTVYYMKDGGMHDYNAGLEYIYNGLPFLFSGSPEPEFIDIYSNFEKIRDPSKKETGMYLIRSGKGEKGKALLLTPENDPKELFPKARELSAGGYDVFIPVLRSGDKGKADLRRAGDFIKDNAEYLGTDAGGIDP